MADDTSYGGFTNPGFVTPEQVLQQRQMVNQLLAGATNPEASKHWTGVLAQALMGAQAGLGQGRADQMQRQILQQGANRLNQGAATNPYAAIMMGGQNPMSPQASNSGGSGDGNVLKSAILMQESGNNPNIRSSYAGAVGPGQIMPQTFASIAKPGESINDATDNRNVSGRLLDKYTQDYGGDPARAAVAYYSGPGNVAPPGSPTPWIRDISHDKAGNPIKPVSSYVSDVTRRMGGGQQMAQNGGGGLGALYVDPSVPQAVRDSIRQGNTPVPGEDVYGVPTVRQGVMGPTTGLPTQGMTPGFRAPATVGPDGGVSTTIVNPAPGRGGPAPTTGGQLKNLFQTGQGLAQEAAINKAEREAAVGDVSGAMLAPQTKQILNTMKSDITAHGDKMVFGPTADWINNLRRSVAQHAPGLLTEADLSGLASADSFDKLSAQLQSIVGRQVGGTDASLLQGMRSVPGQHNSKEGALALIDMLTQVTDQQEKLISKHRYDFGKVGPDGKPFDFLAAKQKYFDEHPITNPLTKKPLREDLSGGNMKMLNGKQYQRLNGVWHEVM